MESINKLNLNEKKYIIFDMDGTLIDSIGIWNITDHQIINFLSGLDIDLAEIQKERDDFLQNNQGSDVYLTYCSYLIEKYNLKLTPQELLDLRWSISGKYLEEEVDFKPHVTELLIELKNRGYILILATATTQVQLDIYEKKNKKMLEKLNIAECFDLIIRKEDVKNKKPHPEIFLTILNHYGASPQECLVFEDSLQGVIASKRAGIETVNVYDAYSDNDRKTINELTDYRIDSYEEIITLLNREAITKTRDGV